MDPRTFTEELQKALRKPEDWFLSDRYIVHRKSGVRIVCAAITGSLADQPGGVLVFSSDYVMVDTVPFHLAKACFQSVTERLKKRRETEDRSYKARFLRKFKGFG